MFFVQRLGLALARLAFCAVHAVDDVLDALLHAARHDAVFGVKAQLFFPAALGFADGPLHRAGDAVGVEDGLAVQIARGAADGLDQAALAAQKAFFVGVQNRHQADFRDVQPLAQQVDAHQHIEYAQAQVAQDFHPLDGVDVRVQIAHLDAMFVVIVGQLLGHALGQRGDQHPLVLGHPRGDFRQQIVHLAGHRADFHFRVHQAGGAHQLLDHLAGVAGFVVGRGGGDKNALRHFVFEFFKFQRPVVQRRRQAKAVFHQIFFARAVAFVHAANLADGDVRFVDDHQRVFGQVINQRRRRFASGVPGKMPRVVFDALAKAHLVEHFQVKTGALLQPLRLD